MNTRPALAFSEKMRIAFNRVIDDDFRKNHSPGIRRELVPSETPYPLDQLRWLPIPVPAKNSGIVGVYFLWDGPRLAYVGQSGNVGKRMYDHKHRRHSLATYMRVSRKDLRRQEALYIAAYRPVWNIEGVCS